MSVRSRVMSANAVMRPYTSVSTKKLKKIQRVGSVGAKVKGAVLEKEDLQHQSRKGREEHAQRMQTCFVIGLWPNGQRHNQLKAPGQAKGKNEEQGNSLDLYTLHGPAFL
jgi:hypothetical protein